MFWPNLIDRSSLRGLYLQDFPALSEKMVMFVIKNISNYESFNMLNMKQENQRSFDETIIELDLSLACIFLHMSIC